MCVRGGGGGGGCFFAFCLFGFILFCFVFGTMMAERNLVLFWRFILLFVVVAIVEKRGQWLFLASVFHFCLETCIMSL